VSDQQAEVFGKSVTQQESAPMVEMDVIRGAGPEYIDATGYHVVNVLVHAATCSCSLWLFRALFAGKSEDMADLHRSRLKRVCSNKNTMLIRLSRMAALCMAAL